MMLGDDGDPCICSDCKYDGVVASDDDAEMSDDLGPWPEKMYLLHPSIKTFGGMVSDPERREYVRADRIEQLERELGVAIEVLAESGRKRGEAEAKLAKAVEIGNKMAASIKGNYYTPNVVAEWNATLAELEKK